MFGASKAQRDEEFTRFAEQAQHSLAGTAWLLTGDRELAADLVQSALVKTYVAWGRVRRADAQAEHDEVVRLLARLPEGQRKVIVLRYFHDLSEADIAETLGITTGRLGWTPRTCPRRT